MSRTSTAVHTTAQNQNTIQNENTENNENKRRWMILTSGVDLPVQQSNVGYFGVSNSATSIDENNNENEPNNETVKKDESGIIKEHQHEASNESEIVEEKSVETIKKTVKQSKIIKNMKMKMTTVNEEVEMHCYEDCIDRTRTNSGPDSGTRTNSGISSGSDSGIGSGSGPGTGPGTDSGLNSNSQHATEHQLLTSVVRQMAILGCNAVLLVADSEERLSDLVGSETCQKLIIIENIESTQSVGKDTLLTDTANATATDTDTVTVVADVVYDSRNREEMTGIEMQYDTTEISNIINTSESTDIVEHVHDNSMLHSSVDLILTRIRNINSKNNQNNQDEKVNNEKNEDEKNENEKNENEKILDRVRNLENKNTIDRYYAESGVFHIIDRLIDDEMHTTEGEKNTEDSHIENRDHVEKSEINKNSQEKSENSKNSENGVNILRKKKNPLKVFTTRFWT